LPKIPGIHHLDAVVAPRTPPVAPLEKAGFRMVRQGKHIAMLPHPKYHRLPDVIDGYKGE